MGKPETIKDLPQIAQPHQAEQPGPATLSFFPWASLKLQVLETVWSSQVQRLPRSLGICLANVRVLSYVHQEQCSLSSAKECSRRSLALPSGQ